MRFQFRLQTPKDYADFLRKRMWWIVIPALLTGPPASFVIYRLPDIYRSSTVILVEPQKIDPNFVRNPISVPIKDRLSLIRNKITSSSNLDLIVKKFKLFEDQVMTLSDQARVELLRKRILIYVDRPLTGSEAYQISYFSISYEDKNPVLAQSVTAEVASQFLSEEERQSKEKIVKTSGFIDAQLEERLVELEARKRELSQVRLQSMVNMPLDAATYAKQLDTLETEISGLRDGVDRWEEKLQNLERDLGTTPKTIERQVQVYDETTNQSGAESSVPVTPPSSSIDYAAVEAELARLRKTYTDNHPDVRKLLRQIETHRAQEEANSKSAAKVDEENKDTATPALKSVAAPNPVYRRLTSQVAQVKRTMESQQSKLQGLLKQKISLEARLAQWPRVTQVIADKTAEINSLEAEFNGLRAKQQEAKLSMELVNRAQTEQFRIQDPANFPEAPVKPSRPKLYLVTWVLALGLGLFLALARDVTDQTIRSSSDVQLLSLVPILVSIPPILTQREKQELVHRRNLLYGLYGLSGIAVLSLAVYAAFNENVMKRVMDYINVYFA